MVEKKGVIEIPKEMTAYEKWQIEHEKLERGIDRNITITMVCIVILFLSNFVKNILLMLGAV